MLPPLCCTVTLPSSSYCKMSPQEKHPRVQRSTYREGAREGISIIDYFNMRLIIKWSTINIDTNIIFYRFVLYTYIFTITTPCTSGHDKLFYCTVHKIDVGHSWINIVGYSCAKMRNSWPRGPLVSHFCTLVPYNIDALVGKIDICVAIILVFS